MGGGGREIVHARMREGDAGDRETNENSVGQKHRECDGKERPDSAKAEAHAHARTRTHTHTRTRTHHNATADAQEKIISAM